LIQSYKVIHFLNFNNFFRLNIEARDLGIPSLTAVSSLTIRVRHRDVNCPVFVQTNYNFRIPEDFPLGYM